MLLRSGFLVAVPRRPVLAGLGSVADPFTGFYNHYNYALSAAQADRLAVRNDWRAVGLDIADLARRTQRAAPDE